MSSAFLSKVKKQADLLTHETPRFVEVSKAHPRYFADIAGRAWIPIGCNICFVRPAAKDDGPVDHGRVRAMFDRWLRVFAANGGNCVRLWAGHRSLEVMPDKPGVFDPEADKTLVGVVRLCEELGIHVKVTLESFRTVRPRGEEGSEQYAALFNRPLYAPFVANMREFFASEECRRIFLDKARHLASLGLGDSPAIYCWEPWNEIDATASIASYAPWSDRMLADLKGLFPHQLVVQNLGSLAQPGDWRHYDRLAETEGSDFLQIHRYLDQGAALDACRGPMDVVAASAVRELLARRTDKPAVLAETGAVLPNHTGPSSLYALDRDGALLHDELFAPFFSGAAGSGQPWHWADYIDANGLWWHFDRFAKAIKGLDPVAERFHPFYTESRRLRMYGLKGLKTVVLWCRDKRNDWEAEFVRGESPEIVTGERIPFLSGEMGCYLPFEDRHVAADAPVLPPFRRSIVVRLPAERSEHHE